MKFPAHGDAASNKPLCASSHARPRTGVFGAGLHHLRQVLLDSHPPFHLEAFSIDCRENNFPPGPIGALWNRIPPGRSRTQLGCAAFSLHLPPLCLRVEGFGPGGTRDQWLFAFQGRYPVYEVVWGLPVWSRKSKEPESRELCSQFHERALGRSSRPN